MQKELDRLLQAPLLPRGFSTRHLAMDGALAGRILASAAASRDGLPVRQGNAMTVESGDTALHALETGKKKAEESMVGVASENIQTEENAKAEAVAAAAELASKKSRRPNKRKRGMKPAAAAKQNRRGGSAKGSGAGGGGSGGKMVGGVYFPGSG